MKTKTDQPTPYAKAMHADREKAQEAEQGKAAPPYSTPWRCEFNTEGTADILDANEAPVTTLLIPQAKIVVRAVNEYAALKTELCKERTENLIQSQELIALQAVAKAAESLLHKVNTMTTDQFEAGRDNKEREALYAALASLRNKEAE